MSSYRIPHKHSPGCWRWSSHWRCCVGLVEELAAILAEVQGQYDEILLEARGSAVAVISPTLHQRINDALAEGALPPAGVEGGSASRALPAKPRTGVGVGARLAEGGALISLQEPRVQPMPVAAATVVVGSLMRACEDGLVFLDSLPEEHQTSGLAPAYRCVLEQALSRAGEEEVGDVSP